MAPSIQIAAVVVTARRLQADWAVRIDGDLGPGRAAAGLQ